MNTQEGCYDERFARNDKLRKRKEAIKLAETAEEALNQFCGYTLGDMDVTPFGHYLTDDVAIVMDRSRRSLKEFQKRLHRAIGAEKN